MPELGTESTYNPAHVCPYLMKMVGYNGVNPPTQEFVLGSDDHGCEFKLYGATSGCYTLWDESEDLLQVVQTTAATSGTERAMTVAQTMTGAGANSEALKASVTSEVRTGSWVNAVFGQVDFGASGEVEGQVGVICGELSMPSADAPIGGKYAVFDAEIDCAGSDVGGRGMVVLNVAVWGGNETEFDDHGYLFDISGVTSTSGGFWYDNTSNAADEFIRVKTPGGDRFIPLSDSGTTWS